MNKIQTNKQKSFIQTSKQNLSIVIYIFLFLVNILQYYTKIY